VNIYILTEEERALEALLIQQEGQFTPEQSAALEALPKKIDGYYHVITNHDGSADALEAEAQRLLDRAAAHRKVARGAEAYLLKYCETQGKQELHGVLHHCHVKEAGGVLGLKLLVPAEQLPSHYRRESLKTEYSADQEKIREAIQRQVEGIEKIAVLAERKKSLAWGNPARKKQSNGG